MSRLPNPPVPVRAARGLFQSFGAAIALIPLLLSAGGVLAQEEGQPVDDAPFVDTVRVEVVELEVWVTDRKGNPITDLSEKDFQVLEDGRPVALTHFRAPSERIEEAAPAPAPRLQIPGTEEPVGPDSDRDPEFLVVYIDNLNIKPFDRNRVFRSLRSFLGREVDPDRKVMLVSYTRSIKERVPFTSDPSLISRGLLEMEGETAMGVQRESERQEALRSIEEADSATFARSQARLYAGSYHNDVMFTIDALREVVDSLAGLPGRKSLLYVSGGVPEMPGEDLFYAVQDKFQDSSVLMEAREFDAGRRFRELAHLANTGGVTFYTIDAAGLRAPAAASVSRNIVGAAPLLDAQETHNLQSPLIQLAQDTGGRYIINTNDPTDELKEIDADFHRFYSLAYQPSHAGDGRYHSIEVKVEGRGLRVRHRQGYRGRSLSQRMKDSTRAALLFQEYENPMDLEVTVGEIERTDDRFTVPILVQIPLDDLVLLDRGDRHEASLEMFFSAADEEGGVSPVQQLRIPITVPADDLDNTRGKRFGYAFPLLMRGGRQRVAIGLYDNVGGTTSFVVGELEVAAR